jgi:hypothetical protein
MFLVAQRSFNLASIRINRGVFAGHSRREAVRPPPLTRE